MKEFILILLFSHFYIFTFANGSDTTIYTIVEQMPRFLGCEGINGDYKAKKTCADQKLLTYLYNNIKVPPDIVAYDLASRVLISFVIDEEGNIIMAKIIKEGDPKMDQHVLDLVKKMPKWIPGRQKGIPVKVKYRIPLRLHLKYWPSKSSKKG